MNCIFYGKEGNLERCTIMNYCKPGCNMGIPIRGYKPTESEMADIMREDPENKYTVEIMTGGIGK